MKEIEKIKKIMSVVDYFDYYNPNIEEMKYVLSYFIENPTFYIFLDGGINGAGSRVIGFKNK